MPGFWWIAGVIFYDQSVWFGASLLAPFWGAAMLVFLGPLVLTTYQAFRMALEAGKINVVLMRHVTRVLSGLYMGVIIMHVLAFAGALYYAISLGLAVTSPASASTSYAVHLAQDIYNNTIGYAILVFVFQGLTGALSLVAIIMAAVALHRAQSQPHMATGERVKAPQLVGGGRGPVRLPAGTVYAREATIKL